MATKKAATKKAGKSKVAPKTKKTLSTKASAGKKSFADLKKVSKSVFDKNGGKSDSFVK